jgi:hypothetical protein
MRLLFIFVVFLLSYLATHPPASLLLAAFPPATLPSLQVSPPSYNIAYQH